MSKLTNKQRAFVEHYLMAWSATEAAKRAGYSDKTAYAQGARLLKNVEVGVAINARISEMKAGADEVVLRLASHSRGSVDDFLDGFGLIDIAKARERGKMHLVKKIKQHTTRISKKDGEDIEYHDVEIELYDAQAATVQLARLAGLYVERVEINDLRDKPDSDLIREFESIVDAARTRAGDSDSQ